MYKIEEISARLAQLETQLTEQNKIILGLKKENKMLRRQREKDARKIGTLKKQVKTFLSELKKYKNSNTPSSANKHMKQNTTGKTGKGGKRGAPKGHTGITRESVPIEKNIVDTDECPNCHGHNTKDDEIIKKVTEEIPQPVPPTVTDNEIHKKECLDCGLKFIPPNNIVPLTGRFGINLMIFVLFVRFILRGVLRKTASFFEAGFALKITPATVNAIIRRASKAANSEYETLKQKVRKSSRVFVDETSFSVLGKNFWLWLFRTNTGDIFLVIRPTRGNKVLAEVLGEFYPGVVHCDCWRAYDFLKNAFIQRCWAHLLRKSKELIGMPGRHFHNKLKALFEEIKEFNKTNPTKEQREEKTIVMTLKLKKLTRQYSKCEEIKPVVKYIDNHLYQWFTCVKLPDVEPTNNLAEQAIRESVMVRKIIGAFRSEDGSKHYERLASLVATWQLQGKDLQKELRSMLIRNLCLS